MAIPCRKDPQLNLRIPTKLKDDLDLMARKNNRSRNSEIVFILETAINEKALSASTPKA